MVTLVNRAKMSTSTTGTGTITLGSAETGYQSFADAGVADGDVVRYVIEDGDDWEIGSGTYTASGTTLTRTVDESSNSDAALNLTGSAVVFITAAAEDVFQGELFAESYDGTTTAPNATGTNAFAIGVQSTSSATNSVAIGTGAYVTHQGGVGLGYSPTVTANYGAAIGANSAGAGAKVSGAGGVALGGSNTQGSEAFSAVIDNTTTSYGASGANSIAIGQQAKGTNTGSLGFGVSTTASGQYALAMGYQSTASGTQSVAIGRANTSSANFALSLGYNSTASASNAVAIGDSNTASHANAIVIGDSVQSTTTNEVSIGGTADTVRISESYTLPTSDGTNGQVLTTDGSGAVTFADAGGSALELYAENPSTPTAPTVTGGTNSVAIGSGSVSDGTNSIAIGTNADSNSGVAIGYNAQTTSLYATAIGANMSGNGAIGAGFGSVALGASRAGGTDSFAAAIASNSASYGATGANSIAIGAGLAKATSSRAMAFGNNAIASGADSVAVGRSTDATASSAFAFGYHCLASGSNSLATGYQSKAATVGKAAYASGSFSGSYDGDAQQGTYVLRSDTTDATAEALTTNNGTASTTNQIILSNESAYSFTGTVVCREDATDGDDYAGWEVKGVIMRQGAAADTSLGVGIVNKLYSTSGISAADVALSADTTNGGLKVEVTGVASTNLRWVATINTSEVINA